MSKFQRQYTIEVEGKSGLTHIIKNPITVVFDISRRSSGSLNSGRFYIYNLDPARRNDIRYDNALDHLPIGQTGLKFKMRAGYESEGYKATIFSGTVQNALSYRQGPEVITEIQAMDGSDAAQYSQIEYTRAAGYSPRKELEVLVNQMKPYGVTLGVIGPFVDRIRSTRGITFLGATWDIIKKWATRNGGYAFIDLGKVYILKENEVVKFTGTVPTLNSSTGLIGTPRRTHWNVNAEMLFEPRIQPGQDIKMDSFIEDTIKGTYQVFGVAHRGTISAAKDGGVITSLSLQQSQESVIEVFPQ